jgi:tripartite ATP-independent transporter DctP family solute receptor
MELTKQTWSRRSVLAAAVCAPALAARAQAPQYRFAQYHNQAASGPLHKNLLQMWQAVARETGGRVTAEVFAENNGLPGGDPDALAMLRKGEIQFFTLMGGIMGSITPVAEAQQLPFAFTSAAHAHRTLDGPFGAYIAVECAAQGIHVFPVCSFDNGMRQIASVARPVRTPDDLVGIKMRVPPGQVIADTFAAFGAQPVTTSANQILDALRSGKADAQENPLAVVDGFRLYEVVRYVSMTNHIWSGFNLMAHLPTWQRLPEDIRDVITRNATLYVRRQRNEQGSLNAQLRSGLEARGLIFNEVDQAPFRRKLPRVYAAWKERVGTHAWALLEAEVGRLG